MAFEARGQAQRRKGAKECRLLVVNDAARNGSAFITEHLFCSLRPA